MHPARILLLPGWQDSGPDHWQSRWEQGRGFERVQQDDWWWPRRGDWMARLEDQLLADDRPALLVAHSLGCHLVAAWAQHSRHAERVAGALLVAPPDLERPDTPPQLHNWLPIVAGPLPFAGTAVLSGDDPFCAAQRGRQIAAAWGCETVMLGPIGHINGDSGLGDWPEGLVLLRALMHRAGVAPGPAMGKGRA
jgi:hypothetical protein